MLQLMLVGIVEEAVHISPARAKKQQYKCRLGRAGLSEKERNLLAGAVLGYLPKRRPRYDCYLELPALLWIIKVEHYFQYIAAYGPTSSGKEHWVEGK
ncbi:unnamed protein product [Cylicostephanus goldi]|uniref:Uncharacterized protein n=1 Tax=Cylicostephanus goldi TaxID=71465 RepID=A0A3P7MSU6_CYLGO|nr:unnamed protein product [Cylicostephanus goldi]